MNDHRHDPQYAQQMERANRIRKSHHRTLIILSAIFGLPVILAIALYTQSGSAWVKSLMTPGQHGLLISPPQWIQGALLKQSDLTGSWSVILMTTDLCETRCLDLLNALQRLHRSLGAGQSKVQIWLITTNKTEWDNQNRNFLQFEVNGQKTLDFMTNLPTEDPNKKQVIMQKNIISGRGTSMGFYLMDPEGRVMMMYPQDSDLKGLRADLLRLLKVSG